MLRLVYTYNTDLAWNFVCSFMLWNFRGHLYVHPQQVRSVFSSFVIAAAACTSMLCSMGLCGGGLSLLVLGELCGKHNKNGELCPCLALRVVDCCDKRRI